MPGVHISDYSPYYSQLAVQGPRALDTLRKLTKVDLAAIKNYWFTWGTVAGIPNVLIARTGYSGEDGFEVYTPSDEATTVKMWNALLEAGGEFGIRPCGLGARNTLRLEAGMSLYGHEISEEINVLEAGLNHWLKLDKGEFIGRDALLAVQESGGPKRKIIGLEMVDRGIARDGYPVLDLEGREVGRGYIRLAGAISQDQHRHGAGAGGSRGRRKPMCWCRCAPTGCGQSRCRCRSTSGRKSSPANF